MGSHIKRGNKAEARATALNIICHYQASARRIDQPPWKKRLIQRKMQQQQQQQQQQKPVQEQQQQEPVHEQSQRVHHFSPLSDRLHAQFPTLSVNTIADLAVVINKVQAVYEHASAQESLYVLINWLCAMSPLAFFEAMMGKDAISLDLGICCEIRRLHDTITKTTNASSDDVVKCMASPNMSSEPAVSLCVRMVCACMCNVNHDHDVSVWMAMSYAERLKTAIPRKECQCCPYHRDEHRKE